MRSNCSNTKTAMADFNLFDMLRMVTQHIQYNVGEVFVIPRRISSDMMGGKIRSNAQSSQITITIMLYQKGQTGVFVGVVFQRLVSFY